MTILIFIGVLTAFVSKEQLKKTLRQLPNYFWIIFLCILLLAFISTLFSSSPFYGAVEISLLLMVIWVALITAHVTQNYYYGKYMVVSAACIVVFLYVLKFSIGYTFFMSGYESFPLWPASGIKGGITGFVNIRFFNQVQAFTLPLLIGGGLVMMPKKRTAGIFCFLLTVIWWMLLIQSAGRGIMLSSLSAALVSLFFLKKHIHRWIWYFLGTLLLGYLLKVILFDIIPIDTSSAKSMVRGGSPRLTLWPQTFFSSLEQPIFGHGPMSFAQIHTGFTPSHPHNSILQLLYELGYPATIGVLIVAGMGFKTWILQTKKNLKVKSDILDDTAIIKVSLTTSVLAGLCYSLVSGVIVMPLSQLWLALVFGTVLGLYNKGKSEQDIYISINTFYVYASKLFIIIAAIVLASVLIRDIPTLRENEKRFVKETDRHVFRPRFWQQGKIGFEKLDTIELKQTEKSNL
ncbi:O-antigen ligase family protein [Fodinibius sp. Rm-B-1B1-1]|uniref:O-antigen ligase family protein n=1 Tax=Fodinibius alkaliphilus TaxID=3140241 RepID=UPI00315A139C